jgi:hypothetical protein
MTLRDLSAIEGDLREIYDQTRALVREAKDVLLAEGRTEAEAVTQSDGSDSEFGRGVVVCLAKFSEHLANEHARAITSGITWQKMSPERQRRWRAESGRGHIRRVESIGLSKMIEMWANGASDHFFGLSDQAPGPLQELAAFTLLVGHGFQEEEWTAGTWKRILELWKESCLAVDRQLGVEPDWGQW